MLALHDQVQPTLVAIIEASRGLLGERALDCRDLAEALGEGQPLRNEDGHSLFDGPSNTLRSDVREILTQIAGTLEARISDDQGSGAIQFGPVAALSVLLAANVVSVIAWDLGTRVARDENGALTNLLRERRITDVGIGATVVRFIYDADQILSLEREPQDRLAILTKAEERLAKLLEHTEAIYASLPTVPVSYRTPFDELPIVTYAPGRILEVLRDCTTRVGKMAGLWTRHLDSCAS